MTGMISLDAYRQEDEAAMLATLDRLAALAAQHEASEQGRLT